MRSVRAPAPQVQPLVEFLRELMGVSHFRTVRIWGYLEIFGAYFGNTSISFRQFPSVSISFRMFPFGFHQFPCGFHCFHQFPCHFRCKDTRHDGRVGSELSAAPNRPAVKPAVSGGALTAKAPEGLLRWRFLWLGGRRSWRYLGDTAIYHQISCSLSSDTTSIHSCAIIYLVHYSSSFDLSSCVNLPRNAGSKLPLFRMSASHFRMARSC